MKKSKKIFITFEGTDGVGKSTHIRLLAEWLKEKGYSVLMTREPGGGVISEKIREILLDEKSHMSNMTELFLYLAARAEHLHSVILPALNNKTIVLCDRYSDATVAYQGYARKMDLKMIQSLNKAATSGLVPDLTIWLDLNPGDGLSRVLSRKGGKLDRLEKEGLQFLSRVRSGYAALAKKEPRRFIRVPVRQQIDETQREIRTVVSKKLMS